jgi:hypothetical protein
MWNKVGTVFGALSTVISDFNGTVRGIYTGIICSRIFGQIRENF